MGHKDKKKHARRSRSRTPDAATSGRTSEKRRKRDHGSSSSASSDDSRSPSRRHHKKSKHKSRDKCRAQDRMEKKHKRSRSRDRGHDKKVETEMEARKRKEILKAFETPEEKRARRLAKKEAKERKRKTNMGWDEEYSGYTNGDNPFGDERLLETFRWTKKMEKEGKKNISKEELDKLQRQRLLENREELEKVKKRRQERELEREARDNEREELQRDKEAEYFSAWEKQEDTFHLQQAKLRSKIRIEDGRAKPIDLLAQYISPDDEDFSVEMHEPYTCLNGLTIADLEDLLEDIKVYLEMEEGRNADFWRDITIITEDEIAKLRKIDPNAKDYVGERRSGINSSVADDVAGLFKGKTLNQLAMLEQNIRSKLHGGEGVDVGYWESVVGQLKAHMARTRLRERHQEQLRAKLFKLKQQQGIESAPLFPIMGEQGAGAEQELKFSDSEDEEPAKKEVEEEPQLGLSIADDAQPSTSTATEPEVEEEQEDEPLISQEDVLEQNYTEYEAGGYSPRYISPSSLDPDTLLYSEEDDIKRLEYSRRRTLQTGRAKDDTDDQFVKRAREGMNDEEAQFSVEVPLEKQTVLWSDKYRPRKPRFFNRVHTGFEWNKYNQTHYDIDNPPPKIVQGYKFNIFYPDLIEKTKTPEYFLTPCEDNKDFAVLRFHSGPPYEDIAFKIVNREWEYSYKRGFRCQFHNNIFQLWFHFKRYRYRR